MSAIMKQMGISQENIKAEKVIIEKIDGKIIIENPNIIKVNMQGQESFQITGQITEETKQEESEEEQLKKDIQTIAQQTGVSEEIAAIELEKNNGDMAETIISLTKHK